MGFRDLFSTKFAGEVVESFTVLSAATLFGGVPARALGWPSECWYTIASQKNNTLSSTQIISQLLKDPQGLAKGFKETGLKQTIWKSASTAGVTSFVNYTWPGLEPIYKGLLGAGIGTSFETYFTYDSEEKRVKHTLKVKRDIGIHDPTFQKQKRTMILITGGRIFITGTITVTAIYANYELMKRYFHDSLPDGVIKAVAAGSASFFVQPLNMPFINLQTETFANPSTSCRQQIKNYVAEETLSGFFRAFPGRCVNRAIGYGTMFASSAVTEPFIRKLQIAHWVKAALEKPTEIEEYIKSTSMAFK